MQHAIWWIRRDLRLTDNCALHAAANTAQQVIPLFIFDSQLLSSDYVGQKRHDFLIAGLHALDQDLRQLGSHLIVRQGKFSKKMAHPIQSTHPIGEYGNPSQRFQTEIYCQPPPASIHQMILRASRYPKYQPSHKIRLSKLARGLLIPSSPGLLHPKMAQRQPRYLLISALVWYQLAKRLPSPIRQ